MNRNQLPVEVASPHVKYTKELIHSVFNYFKNVVNLDSAGQLIVTPSETRFSFQTERKIPRLGLMMVGWGGNNGSTLTGAIIANRENLKWKTKEGECCPNYIGSLSQCCTISLGVDNSGKEVFAPFSSLLPMINPNDLVIGGWDIHKSTLAEAMTRAGVFDSDLQRQLYSFMEKLVPLPSVFYSEDPVSPPNNKTEGKIHHVNNGASKWDDVKRLQNDIQEFKEKHQLDKVIVCWSASAERCCDELYQGINDTANNLLKALQANHAGISASTVFAVASILSKSPFINAGCQNTLTPAITQLAEREKVFIVGDDLKTGQDALKSVLVEYLVSSGIKPLAVTSYIHLGNNDAKNLSCTHQHHSTGLYELPKTQALEDLVVSNPLLFKGDDKPNDVSSVFKYVPVVGDSHRGMNEIVSQLFMGGRSTLACHTACDDSMLAAPIILDLVVFTELMTRVSYKQSHDRHDTWTNTKSLSTSEKDENNTSSSSSSSSSSPESSSSYQSLYPVGSVLGSLLKKPLGKPGSAMVQTMSRQRTALDNFLRALVGLPPRNDILLEDNIWESNLSRFSTPKTELLSHGVIPSHLPKVDLTGHVQLQHHAERGTLVRGA